MFFAQLSILLLRFAGSDYVSTTICMSYVRLLVTLEPHTDKEAAGYNALSGLSCDALTTPSHIAAAAV